MPDPEFVPALTLPASDLPAWWFVFRGRELLMRGDEPPWTLPRAVSVTDIGVTPIRQHALGTLGGVPCFTAEVAPDAAAPAGMHFAGLRELYGVIPDDLYAIAGRAAEIIEWDRTNQFCGRCGGRTELSATDRVKVCPDCGYEAFPRVSPAVIVLVNRGSDLLLAHGNHFAPGMYGLIAGFVETGESLEDAIRREIAEEVGLTVTGIRYFDSQPWPYPHQLMVGFTAAYAGGEIKIEPSELADARWFAWNDLPRIPGKDSLARRLIDAFVARQQEMASGA